MHLPLPDGNTPLGIATDNALRLFDSHVLVGDLFGLTMFDDTTDVVIPLQEVSDEVTKGRLRAQLHQVRQGGAVAPTCTILSFRVYPYETATRGWFVLQMVIRPIPAICPESNFANGS
jgi:hypothetical protein